MNGTEQGVAVIDPQQAEMNDFSLFFDAKVEQAVELPVEAAVVNPLRDLVSTDGKLSMTKLIRLYQDIEEALIESGGLAEFGDQMSHVEGRIEQKLDNCKGLIEYWKGQIAYLDGREKSFKTRKAGIKSGIEWMKSTMKDALIMTGKQKVKTPEGTYYFLKPRTLVKVNPEHMTEKYAAALKKLGLRTHDIIITIPADINGAREEYAQEITSAIPGATWTVTEPEYDLEGLAERWMQGNRKWPAFLSATEKTFSIR